MPTSKVSQFATAVVRSGFRMLRFAERRTRRVPNLNRQNLRSARRFLFLEYTPALGSNVHATPVFEALKTAIPDAALMVACGRMGFEVFKHNPFIDYLVETPRPLDGVAPAVRTLRAHLKATNFVPNVVITSKGNEPRGNALVAFSAGAAIRLGYTFAPELYDVRMQYRDELSLVDNNLRIVEELGFQKHSAEPLVGFSGEDLERARVLLQSTRSDRPRVIFITQTSPTQRKSWPADRFISVANHVTRVLNGSVVFVGTGSEAPNIETIRSGVWGDNISLAGQTTISQLAAVLSLCDYAVSLDTGNMHIGRSVSLPTVILAPAWQPVIEWLPLGNDRYRILKGDDIGQSTPDYVMDEMSVEQVIGELDDLVARYPASEQSREARIQRSLARVSAQSRRPIG
jgi:ADP-heptose:LPS heptosyltransferase